LVLNHPPAQSCCVGFNAWRVPIKPWFDSAGGQNRHGFFLAELHALCQHVAEYIAKGAWLLYDRRGHTAVRGAAGG
jgi:hypothetical protein